MKQVEFWRWEIWAELGPRRRIKTRHHMRREDALATDPTATPIPGTMILRDLPETDEEVNLVSRHSQLAGPPPSEGPPKGDGA